MIWWMVTVKWTSTNSETQIRRSFTDEASARDFMAKGDPRGGVSRGLSIPESAEISWELARCDPAQQPWLFSPGREWWGQPPLPVAMHERLHQARKAIQNYYAGICEHVLAFTTSGLKVEGPLDRGMRARLRRGANWFGMQMYKGDRTLYHLDDGSDNLFVVDGDTLHHLAELGLTEMIRPEWPGDTLHKADEHWTGG